MNVGILVLTDTEIVVIQSLLRNDMRKLMIENNAAIINTMNLLIFRFNLHEKLEIERCCSKETE